MINKLHKYMEVQGDCEVSLDHQIRYLIPDKRQAWIRDDTGQVRFFHHLDQGGTEIYTRAPWLDQP